MHLVADLQPMMKAILNSSDEVAHRRPVKGIRILRIIPCQPVPPLLPTLSLPS
jgi:hypothetical protein